MQANKVIFKGRLDFGSKEVVVRIVRQLETRIVNLYKEDLPWKLEELLLEDTEQVRFLPVSKQIADRTWKHGLDVLGWLAHFALCGEVLAIRISPERSTHLIQPAGQKAAVLLYRHALEEQDPGQREGLYDQILEKYAYHTEALMGRADLALERGDLERAASDLAIVMDRDPENPGLWLRMARYHYRQGAFTHALDHIEKTVVLSMPLEELHWRGRQCKAKILHAMDELDGAEREWRLLEARLEKAPDFLPDILTEVREALQLVSA
jgi:tetratricopeptide (TPR) repeat protein